jgi:hypothetical protein
MTGTVAQAGEWIDLGASEEIEVSLPWDPLTLVRIPPGACGDLPQGTLALIELDAPTCNSPNCVSGQGFLVMLDDRGCCGEGFLERPVTFQVRYLEEAVRQFGADERDLYLAGYEPSRDEWVPLSGQLVDTERKIVQATESHDIRRFVAVFAPGQTGERGSWGEIKALFR